MDKERGIGILFKLVGLVAFLVSIGVLYYILVNPHYFYTLDNNFNNKYDCFGNGSVDKKRYCSDGITPILECTNTYEFRSNNFRNVIGIKVLGRQCYMYNLPKKDPYVKESNKFMYFIVNNENKIVGLYLLVFLLFDLYRYKYKNKSYIKKLYHLLKHRGDK